MQDWKIKLNESKSTHIFALRRIEAEDYVYLNKQIIPQKDSVKYLGMHLDIWLTWKHHVCKKVEQIRLKTRQMYWLIGCRSQLNLHNEMLIYKTIIKPIWTYGIQLWGCTKDTNRLIIQRCQNNIRAITNARWYQRIDLHSDLDLQFVTEIIKDYAKQHETRHTTTRK